MSCIHTFIHTYISTHRQCLFFKLCKIWFISMTLINAKQVSRNSSMEFSANEQLNIILNSMYVSIVIQMSTQ